MASVEDAAQDEERARRRRAWRPVSTWTLSDRVDQIAPAADDAGEHVAVAGQVLRRRLDDEVGAELERPAEVRRGERVVDDVAGAVAMGQRRRGRRGRRRRSSGWRSSRRRGPGSGRPPAPPRPRRGRSMSTNSSPRRSRRGCAGAAPASCRTRPTGGDDPVAGRDERDERRVDRGHPRREGEPASAPSSSAKAAPSAAVVGLSIRP